MSIQPLSEARRAYLVGLASLLEHLPPNGAYIHAARQRLTVVKMCLSMGKDLPNGEEARIRALIRSAYEKTLDRG